MPVRSCSLLLALLLLSPFTLRAQEAVPLPEPPVRYETDLLPPAFHQSRRAAVREALPENAVALVFSAPERNRENDVDFEYRQSSNLYYLTGTHEPNTVLLLAPGGVEVDGEAVTELLFVPPRNAYSEVWVGRRFGAERAQLQLGVQRAVSNERYEAVLTPLLQDSTRRFFHLPLPTGLTAGSELATQVGLFTRYREPLEVGGNWVVRYSLNAMLQARSDADLKQLQPILQGRVNPQAFEDPSLRAAYAAFVEADSFQEWAAWRAENLDAEHPDGAVLAGLLNTLRMTKTDEEIALMQRAVDITTAAHREAMRSIEPEMHEYEVEALIEYVFRKNGAAHTGFPSIVASGENAVILHYNTNRRRMTAQDMVVMDIGAEYHGYTADVTRTVPVDGRFSAEQKTIYELVLKAQQAGIDAAQSGNSFAAPGQAASQVIAEGLRELGLIKSERDVGKFFMHGTSHYLGLYVHDVGNNGPLLPGTVITVEPGIYISPSAEVEPRWWNIGIRIEDDVLITEQAPVVLSEAAPRTVADIEALMQETGIGNLAGKPVRQEETAVEGSH